MISDDLLGAIFLMFSSSDEDDTCVSPLTSPHIVWHALVASQSALSDPLPMLIDCGSPAVLIRSDVVDRLKLRRRSLPKPFPLNDAFGAGRTESTEWVKLQVVAPDGSYTSRCVRAIVVQHLCVPVLLGNPFLVQNHLLVDVRNRALWDARSGIDVLAGAPAATPPQPSPRARRAERREYDILESKLRQTQHADVIRELRLRFDAQKGDPPGEHSPAVSACVVAAVRARVEDLALLERLAREDTAMKERFADCFPSDIPHINRLPTDVYHEFNLKDPNQTIMRRTYDCPEKYREV